MISVCTVESLFLFGSIACSLVFLPVQCSPAGVRLIFHWKSEERRGEEKAREERRREKGEEKKVEGPPSLILPTLLSRYRSTHDAKDDPPGRPGRDVVFSFLGSKVVIVNKVVV